MVKKLSTVTPVAVMYFILFIVFSADSSDWPRWRGPNGDGISTETDWDSAALAKGPKILWQTKVGLGLSNIVIQGKSLYTMGGDLSNDTVFCLNADNGKTIWKYSYECRKKAYGPQATPTIDGDYVYTLSTEGHLHCFNTRKGKVQWFKHLVDDYKVVRPFYYFSGSPVIEGDLLIITVNSYGIALDKRSGKIVWSSPPCIGDFASDVTGSEYATPVIYTQNDKRFATIFSYDKLYSVDVETGKPKWSYKWSPGLHNTDPIIFDNKVFLSSCENVNYGCALLDISTSNPKLLWQNKNMNNHINTSVLIDGYLYGCHGSAGRGTGTLQCVDVKSGKLMWEQNLGRPVFLSAADSKLIMITDMGKLYIAEAAPEKYNEISSAQVFEKKGYTAGCWTSPVLCGGRIYCRSQKGEIVCIDVRK